MSDSAISPHNLSSSDVLDLSQILHNQFNAQTHSQFCAIPSPIFQLVCDHLDIDSKCYCLPLLCKVTKAMFLPAVCCKGPLTIRLDYEQERQSIEGQFSKSWQRNYARLAYACFASSIDCEIVESDISEHRHDLYCYITEMLKSALASSHLRSLKVWDNVKSIFNISLEILDTIRQTDCNQLKRLTSLSLEISMHNHYRYEPCMLDWKHYWQGLSTCHSLEHFCFSIFL